MKPSIYVDGQEGTTGLRIHELLAQRTDVQVLRIDPEKRKDAAERQRLLNAADVAFLCLPDGASKEAVGLVTNPKTCIIDASTAFRTDPTWAYGLPELSAAQREKIRGSKRIAVPGCHASAFLLSIVPLVKAGLIPTGATLTTFSLTGYSGGGKKMIAEYEAADASVRLKAPRHYALKFTHKHLPEMRVIAGLEHAPYFTPVVCNVYSGMAVETFLPGAVLSREAGPAEVQKILTGHYAGEKFVRVMPAEYESFLDAGVMDITACNGTNRADIFVVGHEKSDGGAAEVAVISRLDNLGKGASGAAIQCMNLVLGVDEGTGLSV